jgi:UDP-2,3-diacylglucosamine pyrophosphatase LpxH
MHSSVCPSERESYSLGLPGKERQNGSSQFNIAIISDLHMGEQRNPSTKRAPYPVEYRIGSRFEAFISHLESESHRRGRKWRLIVAGDMMDFLQVTRIPDEPLFDLRRSEREYGLGTSPEKTAWKMKTMMADHRYFFRALGGFVSRGHKCTIISGNHDIEWTVPDTQRTFRDEMKNYLPVQNGQWDRILADGIEFCPWFYYEPGLIWVEHGHQYDGMNSFDYLFAPYLPYSKELMLPVGSLLVRYLLNMMKKRNYYDYDFKTALDYVRRYFFNCFFTKNLTKHIRNFPHILSKVRKFQEEDLEWLREVNDLRMRTEAMRFGIEESKIRWLKKLWVPSVLYNNDKLENLKSFITYKVGNVWRRMASTIQNHMDVRYVVFGHTHKAESLLLTPDGSAKYANSGAWTKAVRLDPGNGKSPKHRHLMYIQVFKDEADKLALMHWKDEACRGEPVRLYRRASYWH